MAGTPPTNPHQPQTLLAETFGTSAGSIRPAFLHKQQNFQPKEKSMNFSLESMLASVTSVTKGGAQVQGVANQRFFMMGVTQ